MKNVIRPTKRGQLNIKKYIPAECTGFHAYLQENGQIILVPLTEVDMVLKAPPLPMKEVDAPAKLNAQKLEYCLNDQEIEYCLTGQRPEAIASLMRRYRQSWFTSSCLVDTFMFENNLVIE